MAETPGQEKRERMLWAALGVFVERGFTAATTDQIAAAATVSKATLYKEFGDKQGVFAALIEDAAERVHDPFAPLLERMEQVRSGAEAVALLGEQFTASFLALSVQQLRRLVIAEAVRFPELGTLYWERGFQRVLASVAACLAVLGRRSLLDVPAPDLAAQHFAGLMLWIPGNQIMFTAGAVPLEAADLERMRREGEAAFLRAYAPSAL